MLTNFDSLLTNIPAAGEPADADLTTIAALTPTRGDIIVANSTPAWTDLAKGSQYQSLGMGANDPAWGAVNLAQSAAVTGVLPAANGGTAADLSATGGATHVLRQASAGAAVTVGALAASDIPALGASKITSETLAHERGGLEADVSAYTGLVKISGGTTSQAVAGTDYATPANVIAAGLKNNRLVLVEGNSAIIGINATPSTTGTASTTYRTKSHVSASSTGALCGWRVAYDGSMGGEVGKRSTQRVFWQFIVSFESSLASGARTFIGLQNTSPGAPSNDNPATATAATRWGFYTNGARIHAIIIGSTAAVVDFDTGIDVVAGPATGGIFILEIESIGAADAVGLSDPVQTVTFRVRRFTSDAGVVMDEVEDWTNSHIVTVQEAEIDATMTNTVGGINLWRCNNAVADPCAIYLHRIMCLEGIE